MAEKEYNPFMDEKLTFEEAWELTHPYIPLCVTSSSGSELLMLDEDSNLVPFKIPTKRRNEILKKLK